TGQRLVELGGEDPRPVAYAAAQPGGADPAAGPELGHRAAPGRGEGGEETAGLVAAERDVASLAAHVERALDDLGKFRGSRHEIAESVTPRVRSQWAGRHLTI